MIMSLIFGYALGYILVIAVAITIAYYVLPFLAPIIGAVAGVWLTCKILTKVNGQDKTKGNAKDELKETFGKEI